MALLDRVQLYRLIKDRLALIGVPVIGPRDQEPDGERTAEGQVLSPPVYLRLSTMSLNRQRRIRSGAEPDHAELSFTVTIVLSERAWDGTGDTENYGGTEAFDAVCQAVVENLHEQCLTHAPSTHQINLEECDETAPGVVNGNDPRLIAGVITFMGKARRITGTTVLVAIPPV